MSTLQCGDQSGFLFAHPCDRLATGQCTTCGKPICVEHTRLAAEGPLCVTCLRETERDRDDADDPYFYGRRSRYTSDDRRAFEPTAAPDDAAGEPLETDTGAS